MGAPPPSSVSVAGTPLALGKSCSMGAPPSGSGIPLASGKTIWFLSGVRSSLNILCFLQKIFAEFSNSGGENKDNRKKQG
jgi:hypothetical protein